MPTVPLVIGGGIQDCEPMVRGSKLGLGFRQEETKPRDDEEARGVDNNGHVGGSFGRTTG